MSTATCAMTIALATFASAQTAAEKIEGITISTHGSGKDWGTERIDGALDDIREVGASWVATHPYAWIRNDGSVSFRAFDAGTPPEYLVRPIREAHERDLRIMIKPHLGYWGSKFSWRGEIQFTEPAECEQFWSTYETWIVAVARACRDADAFVVGTELDKMLDEARWRRIVAAVRAVTDAPLTYAANWTDYRAVKFWDELDAIGVQAYFPIAESPTDDGEVLRTGWRERMKQLREFGEHHDKWVVFTELGYNRSFKAAVEPWVAAMDGPDATRTQETCMRIALEAVRDEPRVVGAFLWKWFPGTPRHVHDFQLQSTAMLQVISDIWRDAR